MRNFFLVSYDIANDHRRRKVAKIAEDFGDRLQYSVFGCSLTEKQLNLLKYKLNQHIKKEEDQILFVDLGPIDYNQNPIPDIQYIGKCWIPEIKEQIV